MENLLPLQVGVTAIENLGLALMVGLLACKHCVAASVPTHKERDNILLRVFAGTSIVTFIVHIVSFWLALASMADVPLGQAFRLIASSAAATQIGHMWIAGMVALTLLAGTSVTRMFPRWRDLFAWCLLLALILSRSAASHAASADNATIAILIDALHLLGTSVWMGSVIVAALLVVPGLMHQSGGQRAASLMSFASFLSLAATVALAAVVLTGVYKTWNNLGPPAPFAFTNYVNILAVKLALVVLATGLGAGNRFFVMPLLGKSLAAPEANGDRAQRTFILILRIESGVLLLVLIAASLLSFTSPTGN